MPRFTVGREYLLNRAINSHGRGNYLLGYSITAVSCCNIGNCAVRIPTARAGRGLTASRGLIIILGLSGISWYTGYIIGQFKLRYPQVHSMADAGEILMGRFGRELLDFCQLALLIFMMASHLLTFTVTLNTITNHGTCTIVFGVVGLVVSFIGALPRTLGKVYYMSIACECHLFQSSEVYANILFP